MEFVYGGGLIVEIEIGRDCVDLSLALVKIFSFFFSFFSVDIAPRDADDDAAQSSDAIRLVLESDVGTHDVQVPVGLVPLLEAPEPEGLVVMLAEEIRAHSLQDPTRGLTPPRVHRLLLKGIVHLLARQTEEQLTTLLQRIRERPFLEHVVLHQPIRRRILARLFLSTQTNQPWSSMFFSILKKDILHSF